MSDVKIRENLEYGEVPNVPNPFGAMAVQAVPAPKIRNHFTVARRVLAVKCSSYRKFHLGQANFLGVKPKIGLRTERFNPSDCKFPRKLLVEKHLFRG